MKTDEKLLDLPLGNELRELDTSVDIISLKVYSVKMCARPDLGEGQVSCPGHLWCIRVALKYLYEVAINW